MTLPLQSMDKAPRDGSEVLLYFRAGGRKCIAEWCASSERWSLCGISLTDAAFSGWLDIPGMARDSARLQWLIDHNAAVCTAMKGMSSVVVNVGTTGEAWVSEYPSSDPRAAIDKEAERD